MVGGQSGSPSGGQSGNPRGGRSGGPRGGRSPSRLRGAFLAVVAALSLVIALPLFALGVASFIAGIVSWLHPGEVAAAWARTLAGLGLIGGGACLAALGWPGVGWLRLGGGCEAETAMSHRLKFIAVIGLLLALVCLPFGAAIRVAAQGSWLGWRR